MRKFLKIAFALIIGLTFCFSFESCHSGLKGAPGKQIGAGWDTGKRRHYKPASAKKRRVRKNY